MEPSLVVVGGETSALPAAEPAALYQAPNGAGRCAARRACFRASDHLRLPRARSLHRGNRPRSLPAVTCEPHIRNLEISALRRQWPVARRSTAARAASPTPAPTPQTAPRNLPAGRRRPRLTKAEKENRIRALAGRGPDEARPPVGGGRSGGGAPVRGWRPAGADGDASLSLPPVLSQLVGRGSLAAPWPLDGLALRERSCTVLWAGGRAGSGGWSCVCVYNGIPLCQSGTSGELVPPLVPGGFAGWATATVLAAVDRCPIDCRPYCLGATVLAVLADTSTSPLPASSLAAAAELEVMLGRWAVATARAVRRGRPTVLLGALLHSTPEPGWHHWPAPAVELLRWPAERGAPPPPPPWPSAHASAAPPAHVASAACGACGARPVVAEWEGLDGLAAAVAEHAATCAAQAPISCPNTQYGCTVRLPRAQMAGHYATGCPAWVVRCSGCSSHLRRQDFAGHTCGRRPPQPAPSLPPPPAHREEAGDESGIDAGANAAVCGPALQFGTPAAVATR